MTPKEKAEDLVGKFSWFSNDEYHELSEQWELNKNKMANAKCSSLIAVDEIIKILPQSEYLEDKLEVIKNRQLIYWQQVKTEIEIM